MNFGRRPSRREPVERLLERVDRHPLARRSRSAPPSRLVGAEGRHRARVGRRLRHDHVARVDQRLADEVDHLLAAGRHDHALRVDERALLAITSTIAADRARHAFGRPVLQRARRRLRRHARHQLRVQLRREGARVGQPAGERDHVRALGQRHHLAHRRALHAARARREQRPRSAASSCAAGRVSARPSRPPARFASLPYRLRPPTRACTESSSTSVSAPASRAACGLRPFLPLLLAGALGLRRRARGQLRPLARSASCSQTGGCSSSPSTLVLAYALQLVLGLAPTLDPRRPRAQARRAARGRARRPRRLGPARLMFARHARRPPRRLVARPDRRHRRRRARPARGRRADDRRRARAARRPRRARGAHDLPRRRRAARGRVRGAAASARLRADRAARLVRLRASASRGPPRSTPGCASCAAGWSRAAGGRQPAKLVLCVIDAMAPAMLERAIERRHRADARASHPARRTTSPTASPRSPR